MGVGVRMTWAAGHGLPLPNFRLPLIQDVTRFGRILQENSVIKVIRVINIPFPPTDWQSVIRKIPFGFQNVGKAFHCFPTGKTARFEMTVIIKLTFRVWVFA
jgi:hypothetical protein